MSDPAYQAEIKAATAADVDDQEWLTVTKRLPVARAAPAAAAFWVMAPICQRLALFCGETGLQDVRWPSICHTGGALDAAWRPARLLLAVVDGLMFDVVTAPGTLSPPQLKAGPDAHLDRLLGTTGQREPEHSGLRSTA